MSDDSENLEPLTPIEEEFKKVSEEFQYQINAKLAEASIALREAVKIAEASGLPFNSDISFINNIYTPKSFLEKFSEVNKEFIEELMGVYPDKWSGWVHSAVC